MSSVGAEGPLSTFTPVYGKGDVPRLQQHAVMRSGTCYNACHERSVRANRFLVEIYQWQFSYLQNTFDKRCQYGGMNVRYEGGTV